MTVTGWKCIYRGKPDSISAAGVAQPSWHTFDRRVWERAGNPDITIELRNLTNDHGIRVPRTIATYSVILRHKKRVLERYTGCNWQRLVRKMKNR